MQPATVCVIYMALGASRLYHIVRGFSNHVTAGGGREGLGVVIGVGVVLVWWGAAHYETMDQSQNHIVEQFGYEVCVYMCVCMCVCARAHVCVLYMFLFVCVGLVWGGDCMVNIFDVRCVCVFIKFFVHSSVTYSHCMCLLVFITFFVLSLFVVHSSVAYSHCICLLVFIARALSLSLSLSLSLFLSLSLSLSLSLFLSLSLSFSLKEVLYS
jgi:hypothetical protein